jgi:hypothetical protein
MIWLTHRFDHGNRWRNRKRLLAQKRSIAALHTRNCRHAPPASPAFPESAGRRGRKMMPASLLRDPPQGRKRLP